jgi:hypothetical protein
MTGCILSWQGPRAEESSQPVWAKIGDSSLKATRPLTQPETNPRRNLVPTVPGTHYPQYSATSDINSFPRSALCITRNSRNKHSFPRSRVGMRSSTLRVDHKHRGSNALRHWPPTTLARNMGWIEPRAAAPREFVEPRSRRRRGASRTAFPRGSVGTSQDGPISVVVGIA